MGNVEKKLLLIVVIIDCCYSGMFRRISTAQKNELLVTLTVA
jgi:hypothetical protein